jgi:hypothetical protein
MQEDASSQGRPKLVSTRPKEPELQISHRVEQLEWRALLS